MAAYNVKNIYQEPEDPSLQAQSTGIIGNAKASVVNPIPSANPVVATAPVANNQSAPVNDYKAQAQNLYQTNFGRAGDDEGINYWANQLAGGANINDVTNSFKNAAKNVYEQYATDPNYVKNNPVAAGYVAQDMNKGIISGANNPQWNDQYLQSQTLRPDIYGKLYAGDVSGADASTSARGLGVSNRGQYGERMPGLTIGNPTGQGVTPVATDAAFRYGVNVKDAYAKAGIAMPTGSYSGPNGSWVPDAGASDTLEARNLRIKALTDAGMPADWVNQEADNGFWMPATSDTIPWQSNKGKVFGADGTPTTPTQPTNNYLPPSGTGAPLANNSGGGIIGAVKNNYLPSGAGSSIPANSQGAYIGADGKVYTQDGKLYNSPNGAFNYMPATLGSPTQWNVTPQQTVQGQLKEIIDPNGALAQQARTRGMQYANDRGLLNSSMGQTAADSALYDQAMQIANADATIYAKAGGYNADMSNQFATQNVNAQNTAGQFNANASNNLQANNLQANTSLATTEMNNAASQANAQLAAKTQEMTAKLQAGTQLTLADKELYGKLQMADYDAKTRINLANIDSATRTRLGETEANYKNVLQTNQSAANIYQQITQNIAAIQTSSLSADAKSQAITNLETKLKESLSVLGAISGMNLGDLVTVSTPTVTPPTPNADYYGSILEGIP